MGESERERCREIRKGYVLSLSFSLTRIYLYIFAHSLSLFLFLTLFYFLSTSNSRGIRAKQFFPVNRSVSVVSRKTRKYPRVGKVCPSLYLSLSPSSSSSFSSAYCSTKSAQCENRQQHGKVKFREEFQNLPFSPFTRNHPCFQSLPFFFFYLLSLLPFPLSSFHALFTFHPCKISPSKKNIYIFFRGNRDFFIITKLNLLLLN